ncbi:MAG TPA: CocE/NonD family hydrolase [Ktedonobacterales bacterium]
MGTQAKTSTEAKTGTRASHEAGPVRRLAARALQLPPPRFMVGVERDIPVRMPDGATLMTDRYWPKTAGPYPTVLIRTPYGRGLEVPGFGGLGMMMAAGAFAARGFAVVVQTVRGRFDSDGVFEPRADEPADGRATMRWIAEQPWFGGALGMWGQSYLGFVQWAVAGDAPDDLKAIVPAFTSAAPAPVYDPDRPFALRSTLEWIHVLQGASGPDLPRWRAVLANSRQVSAKALNRALAPAVDHLPFAQADARLVGKPVPFYRELLAERTDGDGYWQARDFTSGLTRVRAAVSLMGGWYDLFLRDVLRDYETLRAAGKEVDLTLGPWTHTDPRALLATLREGIRWFAIHLHDDATMRRRLPVRLFLMGANEWREYASWPPQARERSYYLHANGKLTLGAPRGAEPEDSYTYNPAMPTPAVAGPVLMPPSGAADNRQLEARGDVLLYTSAPLPADLDVIGPVRAVLFVRSSAPTTDFFARLVDVYPDGRSINICDDLVRVGSGAGSGVGQQQPDGTLRLEMDLWATAQRFKRGHRVRLVVASAQHPRWARNLNTGEPAATSTRMQIARQTIYHDAAHPSALILPVVSGS